MPRKRNIYFLVLGDSAIGPNKFDSSDNIVIYLMHRWSCVLRCKFVKLITDIQRNLHVNNTLLLEI